MGSELMMIDGGAKMQRRGGKRQDITPEQIDIFLTTLADTCNVVRSSKAAGMSTNYAYRRRRRDATFRTGWAEAVREGYAKLELILLERAIKGTPKLVRTARGTDRVMRHYSTPLAVALLKRHADTADEAAYQHGEDELREVRERILDKLERIRQRDAARADGNGTVEIKAGVERRSGSERVALITWAVKRALHAR